MLVGVANSVGCVGEMLNDVIVAIHEAGIGLEMLLFPVMVVKNLTSEIIVESLGCAVVVLQEIDTGLVVLSPLTSILLVLVLTLSSLLPLGHLVVLPLLLPSSLLYIGTSFTQKASESVRAPSELLKIAHGGKCTLLISSPGGMVHLYFPDHNGTFAISLYQS